MAERCYPLLMLGHWNEVLETRDGLTEEQLNSGGVILSVMQAGVEVYCRRGALEEARRLLALFGRLEASSDLQDRGTYLAAVAALPIALTTRPPSRVNTAILTISVPCC